MSDADDPWLSPPIADHARVATCIQQRVLDPGIERSSVPFFNRASSGRRVEGLDPLLEGFFSRHSALEIR